MKIPAPSQPHWVLLSPLLLLPSPRLVGAPVGAEVMRTADNSNSDVVQLGQPVFTHAVAMREQSPEESDLEARSSSLEVSCVRSVWEADVSGWPVYLIE